MSSKDCTPASTPGSVTGSCKVPNISSKSTAVYSSGIRSCLPPSYATNSSVSAICQPGSSLTNRCQANICLQTPSRTTPSLFIPCQPSNRQISSCLPPTSLPPPFVPPACMPFPARAINCYLGGSYCSYNEGIFTSNGKETMQFLNDRLACYLEKVKSLENENADLERKIQEWHETQPPYECTDFNCCYRTIEELQQQIGCAKADNARICLDIDNLKVASDDYCSKTDYEKGLRQSAETDIDGLRRVLDSLTLCKADLEAQLESLTAQLLCLKKNHEEVANPLRCQLGNRINVEVDAGPSCNLNKVLEEIRCQYETLVEKNRCEVENWYHAQMEELNKEVISSGEQLQCSQTEVIQLKHAVQALEIDLQSQHNMNAALENSLAETETRHSNQIAELQSLISNVEAQLAELRSDIECQNCEYKVLLDAKYQLDCEINAYRRLLEGGSASYVHHK